MPYEDVPGLVWVSDLSPRRRPVVVAGHGFTRHKKALFPTTLVEDLTSRGFAVAGIDAPAHGERAADAGDTAAVDVGWRAHWREFGATRIAAEHRALLEVLVAQPQVDVSRAVYFGLSLGTQYGVGILAAEPRFRAAVLGLSALPEPGPRIAAYAERVVCPVLFIQQLDDEIAAPDRALALFEHIGSGDKTLVANPGAHMAVPTSAFEQAYDFLTRNVPRD